MSPLLPVARTRLDPRYPLLWRDATTVQFGAEDVLRIQLDAPWAEPLLRALARGFRRSSFDVIAHGVGAPRTEARALLARLEPVLREDPPPPPPFWIDGANIADERLPWRLADMLEDEGLERRARGDHDAVGVIAVQGAVSALHLTSCLREDLAHLPVSFEYAATTVGPLIRPGRTPCLSCRDAHEGERDPAWPQLHAQLVGGRGTPVTATRIARAADLVVRLLQAPLDDAGVIARISPDGRCVWRSVRFHAGCRCRASSFRSPRGTSTARALPAQRSAPTTATAFARPA